MRSSVVRRHSRAEPLWLQKMNIVVFMGGPNEKRFSTTNVLMPLAVLVAIAILLGGCALSPQSVLKPGSSTEADVEARMGPSADRRQARNGETVRYYSRLPSERESYAARF